MNSTDPPNPSRRRALIIAGAMDILTGALLLVFGLGWLPAGFRPADFGMPAWAVILGGVFFLILGTGVFVYNFSRFYE